MGEFVLSEEQQEGIEMQETYGRYSEAENAAAELATIALHGERFAVVEDHFSGTFLVLEVHVADGYVANNDAEIQYETGPMEES